MRIRKKVYDLKPEDLSAYPVWQFALDEEDECGQDETTVRPVNEPLDPGEGMCIAKTEFILNDGSILIGYSSPSPLNFPNIYNFEGDEGWSSAQPTIVTTSGTINFWYGIFKPAQEEVSKSYKMLGGKTSKQVFPIKYKTIAKITTGELSGVIPGFLFVEKLKKGFFKSVDVVSVLT